MQTMITNEKIAEKRTWLRGVMTATPIVLGYIPVGFAFGVLSQKAGISLTNSLLMSILVYAGSAQLIAAGLLGAGVPALSVIIMTFIVNLRHLLMSASLSPYLNGWKKRTLAWFAFELTDESFAVHSARFSTEVAGEAEILATNLTAHISWVFGTWLGVVAGQLIQDVKPFGLDYALPAMFVALLILQMKDRIQIVVAVFTGLTAVGLTEAGMDRWNVIVATLLGATLGVVIERWIKKRFS